MGVICSPEGVLDVFRPAQGVGDLADAGFSGLLLDMKLLCSEYELEQVGKPLRNGEKPQRVPAAEQPALLGEYARVVTAACEGKLAIPLARGPQLLRDTKRTDLNGLLERLAAESIRFCGKIGCGSIVIRPLFAGVSSQDLWEANRAYYLRLAEVARENSVTILLENQCRDFSGHLIRGVCSDPETAARWVDHLNEAAGEERFGFCMDVGVCRICGQDMRDFAVALGKRLKVVLLRECDGYYDTHLMPFTIPDRGQSQRAWLGLVRGLREIDFDGLLCLSAADTFGAFSPLLRPQVLSLAHSVANYFKWQIELEGVLKKYPSLVLFGAGNMCRNYMKCYGEKYRPLFACSNSERQWGTEFCGLEVRPPEALREIPADCAILICNIYYREIEQQLRDMGLPNPIDYFNDEYMPSFYFDRLKGR